MIIAFSTKEWGWARWVQHPFSLALYRVTGYHQTKEGAEKAVPDYGRHG